MIKILTILLLLIPVLVLAGEKEDLLLQRRALQAEIAHMETLRRLLPYMEAEKRGELETVNKRIAEMEKDKKKDEGGR